MENAFFNYVSSVSSSLIMFSTVRYIIFISTLKSLKVLHFDEHNITIFLKRFEKQCDEYKIIEKKQEIKFFDYYIVSEQDVSSV